MRHPDDTATIDTGFKAPARASASVQPNARWVHRGAQRLGLSRNAWVVLLIVSLVALKLVVAVLTPLAFDEALYWRYSQHLAAGFIDHPFMNPLMIRIGTSLLGNTPLGVRFMAVLIALPASWAVWRTSWLLFENVEEAATAALFFNLTIVMSVGSLVATSDEVVVVTTCFLLLFLAELQRTGRGYWWLAVGVAFGLGMCSKYTTSFFAASILAWLVLVPSQRRWLLSPWAWAGGAVALLIFSPVLLWNAQHHWISFVYQSGRLTVFRWTGRYLAELLDDLILLATPPIFVLGVIGLATPAQQAGARAARVLLGSMIAPMLGYFVWHATHARVQGNWPEPIFPAFAVAAAHASMMAQGRRGALAATIHWSHRLATPVGLGLAALVYLEAVTGFLPLGSPDHRAKVLGVGWTDLGAKIERLRLAVGARAILTTDYPLNSWARFYLPQSTPVEEIDERVRWINEPAPDPNLFSGRALYLCRSGCSELASIRSKFRHVGLIATLQQDARHHVGPIYSVYEVQDPTGPVLDPADRIYRADHEE